MNKNRNASLNHYWNLIRSLIEPPPAIVDIQQRHQSRLLSALLLIIIVLGGLSGMVQLLTVPGFFPSSIAILGAMSALCFAYLLARTKYYLFAATLTALVPFIASYAALLQNTEDQSAFVFLLISVLVSSILLNRWLTLSFALVNLLGLVLLPVIQPGWTFAIVSGKVSFHIVISALILIAMWQRDKIERDRQRELSESELKFRSIFDRSVDAIGVSRDGVHIMANPAYVRMFKYDSLDSLVGSPILDLIAPSERARIQENIRRRSRGEDVPAFYETRGRRRDGTEFDMEVHVSAYELAGKLYTVPILRDITERKKTEEKLRAGEELYKLLFESNPQPMWVYDTNSLAFLAVNDEAIYRYGYSREEFLRMTIKDIRPGDDIPRLMANIAHLPGGLDHAGNWRHIKKDGSLIDVEITSHLLVFEGTQAELVIANDITARMAAEKALRKSEYRYRAIVEGTTDLICRFLPDTTLTFVNEAYCRYFGKSRDELVGTHFLTLIPENDWPAVRKHVSTVIRNKEPVTYSHEVITPGGKLRWQLWTDSTIENEDGEVVELQSVGRDITEQTLADKSLKESERRFRVMFESVGLAGVMLDEKGRITFINDFLLRITNWSREDVLGEDWFDRFLPLEIREFVRAVFNQVGGDEPFIPHYENEILTRRGEKRLIRWNNTALYDSIGNFTGTASIGEDITESRQAQEAIRSSEERYRLLFASNPHPMWVYDMDSLAFLAVNDAAIEKYGYSQGEFFQLTMKDIRPRDDIPRLLDNVKHVSTGLDSAGYWRHIKKDGELIDVEITSHPFLFEGHRAELVLANDVTERKRVEDEREKLFRELEAKNIEAETLRDSAAAVALSLDLKETASRILDQLQRVVPYDSASVHLLLGNELQIVAGSGFPDGKDPTGMRFVLDQNDPAYPILNDGSPYVLYSNVQEISDKFNDYFHQHIFSWIAVPLHARGRLIGILTVDGFSTGKFTEDHAHFASTFANQVAVTLENSRLYTDLQNELSERQKAEKELRQREVILDAVAASAELLLKASDWKVIINQILEKLGGTINASHAYLFEAHPGPDGEPLLSIRHEWSALSFASDLDNSLYHNMPVHEPGLERWHELVIMQNQPFVGDRVKSSALEMEILNERGIRAIIDMPIVVDEEWWGVIGFDDMSTDREWTNVEIDALKVAANVLSSAIQRQGYDIALMDELHKRKNLIEELEQKNAELERFTYTVSHDLKSPLVTIKGFLGYIQQDVASGNRERLNSDLERIGNATKKMEKLLWDLLELSRIGRLVGPSEEIPFEDLVREATELVHGQLVAHRVTVRVQPDLPAVYGDRQRLVEVLQNLLDNAAKYMGDQVDPRIEIGLGGMEDNRFIFYVCDNGIGIVSQHHERVFGLFNKLDVHSEGTGVGLALARRIIEFHGGRIWVESEGNNLGATFCFTLPRP